MGEDIHLHAGLIVTLASMLRVACLTVVRSVLFFFCRFSWSSLTLPRNLADNFPAGALLEKVTFHKLFIML